MTEHILEEYLKNEQEEAALRGMSDDERQIYEEKKRVTGFITNQYSKP
jgi:hypothetical protein